MEELCYREILITTEYYIPTNALLYTII